jgi:hypothetical protein
MHRDDADVAVMFLTAAVSYTHPVDEPWFHAQKQMTKFDTVTSTDITLYIPESPATAMGCTIHVRCEACASYADTDKPQHQFCIERSSGDHCSKMDSLPVKTTSSDWVGASSVQLSALQLLVEANQMMSLVNNHEVSAASHLGNDGVIVDQIPPDQWITKVRAIESVVWAALQVYLADYATGPVVRSPESADYIITPTT